MHNDCTGLPLHMCLILANASTGCSKTTVPLTSYTKHRVGLASGLAMPSAPFYFSIKITVKSQGWVEEAHVVVNAQPGSLNIEVTYRVGCVCYIHRVNIPLSHTQGEGGWMFSPHLYSAFLIFAVVLTGFSSPLFSFSISLLGYSYIICILDKFCSTNSWKLCSHIIAVSYTTFSEVLFIPVLASTCLSL